MCLPNCFLGEKLVVTEHIGNVCLIGINRPEKRNCVNLETADQLLKAVKDFEADDNLRVGVLHGKGKILSVVGLLCRL